MRRRGVARGSVPRCGRPTGPSGRWRRPSAARSRRSASPATSRWSWRARTCRSRSTRTARRGAIRPVASRAWWRSRGRALDGVPSPSADWTGPVPLAMTSPFVPGSELHIAGAPDGPLAGLTFAAKDLFDVAGHPTGGGNPDWSRAHPLPVRHAWAVQRLLDAGATLVGKTITDEVSLGILGENPFDGTPLNPRDPDRVPGGSSSGSASAVAQGLCDTALGTDTGGSVRVPASFCGLYGIRPTHGRLDLSGMMRQAPSSDTTGWFARDAETFARVSETLLGEPTATQLPSRLVIAVDAFGLADDETAAALEPVMCRLRALVKEVREEVMAPPGLTAWARAQRTLLPFEAWHNFQDWIERANPRFQFSVARNLI